MTDELHILEIHAHELRARDWYYEIGTRSTPNGIWWRILADVEVFDQTGSVRDGVITINQVHMRFAGDDAWYAARYDENILVRGLKSRYLATQNKKENPVSQTFHIDELRATLVETDIPGTAQKAILEALSNLDDVAAIDDERYTEEDVRTALKISGLDRNLEEKLEYLEAARSARRGDIRETKAGLLNREDHGKKIRLEHITRAEETLTHVTRLDNVPKVLLVLNGFVWDVDPEMTVFIDDASTPDKSA